MVRSSSKEMILGELRNVENQMRERFQRELDGLAIFICGAEFADQRHCCINLLRRSSACCGGS